MDQWDCHGSERLHGRADKALANNSEVFLVQIPARDVGKWIPDREIIASVIDASA